MRTLIMIAAAAENNALGKDNGLLWHLPDDFKRFKKLTSGHKIIMGRKTFDSLDKPLPNRTHIIITRDKNYIVDFDSCLVVNSLGDAIQLVENEIAFIIGGGEIYKLAEKRTDKIELTRVHASFDNADTFFPQLDENYWMLTKQEFHPADDKHKYSFTYLTYEKKKK
ncbi:dihydrofolate reductase [Maribacter sp. X9]|uniref:dihydrofolate reductase n=1 Tax=Maribacter sp. X9 TaxID=3402159 RepID=UPI003AF39B36